MNRTSICQMTMLGIVAEKYFLLALIRGVPGLKSLWASEKNDL
jgi:hypothetical protein